MFDWGYQTEPEPEPRTAAASRRCAARCWAARPRSTSWPIRAAIAAITTAGRRRARAAGPTPTCCPISSAPKPGRTATILARRLGPARHRIRQDRRPAVRRLARSRPRPPAIRSTDDYNGKQQEGFGRGQYTIRDGRRSSSARAYLRPARKRANLTVETGAHAHARADAGHARDRRRICQGRRRARRAPRRRAR